MAQHVKSFKSSTEFHDEYCYLVSHLWWTRRDVFIDIISFTKTGMVWCTSSRSYLERTQDSRFPRNFEPHPVHTRKMSCLAHRIHQQVRPLREIQLVYLFKNCYTLCISRKAVTWHTWQCTLDEAVHYIGHRNMSHVTLWETQGGTLLELVTHFLNIYFYVFQCLILSIVFLYISRVSNQF